MSISVGDQVRLSQRGIKTIPHLGYEVGKTYMVTGIRKNFNGGSRDIILVPRPWHNELDVGWRWADQFEPCGGPW